MMSDFFEEVVSEAGYVKQNCSTVQFNAGVLPVGREDVGARVVCDCHEVMKCASPPKLLFQSNVLRAGDGRLRLFVQRCSRLRSEKGK